MGTTQPIKDISQINAFKEFFTVKKPNFRNYALFCIGINSALRISDLLKLTWEQVYNFEKRSYRKYIFLVEQKTSKQTQIAINKKISEALELYRRSLPLLRPGDYLFPGGKGSGKPLSRVQAYRIIKNAANTLQIEESISCHSLRKTFGYHAWQQGVNPTVLMEIFNHSSYWITRKYLGINQDDKDAIFLSVNL